MDNPPRMPEFPSRSNRIVLEPECKRCPSLVESRNAISWGTGPQDARIMVVGEAPGTGDPSAEVWQGGNWTGMAYTTRHSGRVIRDIFEELGYGPDDCYYTNTVKCCPTNPRGDLREPTTDERMTCFQHLTTELSRIDPAVILPTGRVATETLLSFEDRTIDGFLDVVLEQIQCTHLDCPLVPLLHPSYQSVWLSRLGYTREEYLTDLSYILQTILD